MHLSRSMVATLAVIGATCALPAIAASQAATPAPKPGPYVDAKATIDMRVAKDRKTLAFMDGSCFANHVQDGVWKVSKLPIRHNAFTFDGHVKVLLVTPKNASKVLTFKIRGKWTGARFTGSVSTSDATVCETRKFSAKFNAHPDA
jgi:hypothetical protein